MDPEIRNSVNSRPFEQECPTCGATIPTTVGEARMADTLRCVNGHELQIVDRASFEAGVGNFERRLQSMRDALTN